MEQMAKTCEPADSRPRIAGEEPPSIIDYAAVGGGLPPTSPRPGVLRKRWAVAAATLVVAVGLTVAALRHRSLVAERDEWHSVHLLGTSWDYHGNHAVIDDREDAVSIVATPWAGWGASSTYSDNQFVVVVGRQHERYIVARAEGTLAIRTPEGGEQRFPIPAGWARRLAAASRHDGSLLGDALAVYPAGPDRERLARFLAGHQEPEHAFRRPATSPATQP